MTKKSAPDSEKLNENLAKINELTQRMVAAMADRKGHNAAMDGPDQKFYAKAAGAYFAELMSDPPRIMEAQVNYWTERLKNWSDIQQQIVAGEAVEPSEPSKDR